MKSDERPSDGLTGLLPTLIARAFKTWPSKSEMKELRVELRLLALGSQGQCSSSSGLSCSWPGRPSQPLPAFAARVASVLVRMNFMGLLVVPSYLVSLDSKNGLFGIWQPGSTTVATVRMYKLPRWQLRAGARQRMWL